MKKLFSLTTLVFITALFVCTQTVLAQKATETKGEQKKVAPTKTDQNATQAKKPVTKTGSEDKPEWKDKGSKDMKAVEGKKEEAKLPSEVAKFIEEACKQITEGCKSYHLFVEKKDKLFVITGVQIKDQTMELKELGIPQKTGNLLAPIFAGFQVGKLQRDSGGNWILVLIDKTEALEEKIAEEVTKGAGKKAYEVEQELEKLVGQTNPVENGVLPPAALVVAERYTAYFFLFFVQGLMQENPALMEPFKDMILTPEMSRKPESFQDFFQFIAGMNEFVKDNDLSPGFMDAAMMKAVVAGLKRDEMDDQKDLLEPLGLVSEYTGGSHGGVEAGQPAGFPLKEFIAAFFAKPEIVIQFRDPTKRDLGIGSY